MRAMSLHGLTTPGHARAIRLLAPAKLNLVLRVGPAEANGYHPLASWMCTVGLSDELTVETAGGDSRPPGGNVACPAFSLDPGDDATPEGRPSVASVPGDESNLVVRAAMEFGRATGVPVGGVRLRLKKRIPAGAGLGGGSSDAAATLLALNEALALRLTRSVLAATAAKIGSDVPFFLHAPSAACTGRGEIVSPTPPPTRARWALLLLPRRIALATPAVYRRFDQLEPARSPTDLARAPGDWAQWAELGSAALLSRLENDLEPAAFSLAPALGELRDQLERALQRPVRMSGSGSTLFTLFDSPGEAEAAVGKVAVPLLDRDVATAVAPLAPDLPRPVVDAA